MIAHTKLHLQNLTQVIYPVWLNELFLVILWPCGIWYIIVIWSQPFSYIPNWSIWLWLHYLCRKGEFPVVSTNINVCEIPLLVGISVSIISIFGFYRGLVAACREWYTRSYCKNICYLWSWPIPDKEHLVTIADNKKLTAMTAISMCFVSILSLHH